MALEKAKRGCPYGKELNESNEAVLARFEALEAKMAAVLTATGTDNGKTLQIDSNGKVALVTV